MMSKLTFEGSCFYSFRFRSHSRNLLSDVPPGTLYAARAIGWATQDSVIPDSTRMGEIRSLRLPMRIIQFGMKLHF